jgi:hypothetical protein
MIFPPLMMWIIGFSIRIPEDRNTEVILGRLNALVYGKGSGKKMSISVVAKKKNTLISVIFRTLNVIVSMAVFVGIAYGLMSIGFSLFGLIIFFTFMSLVLLFAFRIRFNASELRVEGERESTFENLFGFITLPFLKVGFYLSKGLTKLNFLTILLDFLIEAPFKSFIETLESWTSYVREKKDEVVEVPDL